MFPNECTNCQSDLISGPHKVYAGGDQPWIFIENKQHRFGNKRVKMVSYICLNCGAIKLLAVDDDLKKLNKFLEEQVTD